VQNKQVVLFRLILGLFCAVWLVARVNDFKDAG
jgi:hypothetical protein